MLGNIVARIRKNGDTNMRAFTEDDSTKSCSHGEAETRMQFPSRQELSKPNSGYRPSETNVIQVSRDTDNVCFALLVLKGRGLKGAYNVFVKVGNGHYHIKSMICRIPEREMTTDSVARVYSLSSNDYEPSCAVASNESMARVYVALN